MKKNIVWMLAIVILFTLYVPPSVFAAPVNEAVMVKEEQASPSPDLFVDESQGEKSEYILPYPGILPDHPLYMVKLWRDRIMEWLISDPIRKIEYYILQGDKYLNAAVFLKEKGNVEFTEKAITDSNKMTKKAIIIALDLTKQGRVISPHIVERLRNSLSKHIEVVRDFAGAVPEPQVKIYATLLEQTKELEADVGSLAK